jgi:stage II sporulation protein D (peptidoglycan lytic transglycosylase)
MVISPLDRLRQGVLLSVATGVLLIGFLSGVAAAQSIRVLLSTEVQRLDVRAEGPIWMTDSKGRGQALKSAVQITVNGSGFLLNGAQLGSEQLTLRAGEQGLTLIYRKQMGNGHAGGWSGSDPGTMVPVSGLIRLVRKGKGFLLINQVDMEEYVKGVVPAEVNSTWHPEMLKSQAVAARTYALYQQMLSATREYDVAATVQDQVYRGKHGIDAGVEQAVEATRGLVITYQNAPIYAAFSSTAAGLTEDAMNVWSKDLPYLKGVECPFDLESPFYQWKSSFKIDALEQNLRQQGFPVGAIATMTPVTFSRGGRVATLRILHSGGELVLRGEDLRKAIGYSLIPSTQFTVDSIGQDIVLSGYGAGHAVGMCQWGAKQLAELGYSYPTILHYYYPGTELQNMALTKPPTPPPS